MTWNPITEPQDWVSFAGQRTPGYAEVRGAGTPRKLDERESVGLSGAYVVYMGLRLSRFSVLIRLLTPEDWEAWDAFKPLVQKVPLGKRQRPLDISHPLLADCGIHSAIVEDVLQADQVEDSIWQIEIKLLEYRSPRVAMAAAQGSQAEPADPEDAEIEENRQQIEALGQELGGR